MGGWLKITDPLVLGFGDRNWEMHDDDLSIF
jgi:hypothetical protein